MLNLQLNCETPTTAWRPWWSTATGGSDNFLIGRVLKTKQVEVDGRMIEVVGGDGITPGVSFNSYFYGGPGDDYFEVNYNVGELFLFGESGDDTFFLKALLQETAGNRAEEVAGGEIVAGAGDNKNVMVGPADSDTLINYLENNRVEIFGGRGFETVVVAGTEVSDTFYVFTDNDGRQYLFGAGLKLENLDGIERLALLTGAGDDTVYLYGLAENRVQRCATPVTRHGQYGRLYPHSGEIIDPRPPCCLIGMKAGLFLRNSKSVV